MEVHGPILVVSDVAPDATMVRDMLAEEFDDVQVATEPDQFASDLEAVHPRFIVYACDTIDAALKYNARIQTETDIGDDSWKIILCTAKEVAKAYDLVRAQTFDEYVVFWPLTHDVLRVRAAIHVGARKVAAARRSKEAMSVDGDEIAAGVASIKDDLTHGFFEASAFIDELQQILDTFQSALKDEVASLVESTLRKVHSGQSLDMQDLQRIVQQGFDAQRTEIENLRAWLGSLRSKVKPEFGKLARSTWHLQGGCRALIVDDTLLYRRILGHLLSEAGLEYDYAKSGSEAKQAVQKQTYDIIFLEVALGDKNGFEVLNEIRATQSRVPVIMVTSHSDADTVLQSISAGAADFIAKPFSRAILMRKVGRVLGTLKKD